MITWPFERYLGCKIVSKRTPAKRNVECLLCAHLEDYVGPAWGYVVFFGGLLKTCQSYFGLFFKSYAEPVVLFFKSYIGLFFKLYLEAFLRHVKAILGYFSKAILGYFSSYIGLFSL